MNSSLVVSLFLLREDTCETRAEPPCHLANGAPETGRQGQSSLCEQLLIVSVTQSWGAAQERPHGQEMCRIPLQRGHEARRRSVGRDSEGMPCEPAPSSWGHRDSSELPLQAGKANKPAANGGVSKTSTA